MEAVWGCVNGAESEDCAAWRVRYLRRMTAERAAGIAARLPLAEADEAVRFA